MTGSGVPRPTTAIGGAHITTIALASANCYLLPAASGFVMVDTGLPSRRADIDTALAKAGCVPGRLQLIVLTHGDYDHAGNAAHLRERFGAKLAMHRDDVGRVERGDWNWGLKAKPDRFSALFRIAALFIKPGPFDTFQPDLYLEDGQSLDDYGSDARVLHLPGHTPGSIGILTSGRDLFCGDLLANFFFRPGLEFFINDLTAARASVERLRGLGVRMVYPGHGRPFPMERLPRGRA